MQTSIFGTFTSLPPVVVGGTGGGSSAPAGMGGDSGPYYQDSFTEASTIISGASAVATIDKKLRIPANVLKVGDIVEFCFANLQVGRYSSDTTQLKVQLTNASGATLFDSTALNATAAMDLPVKGSFVVTDIGTSGTIKAEASIPFATADGNYSAAVDTTQPITLVETVTHSSNNAGNQTQAQFGWIRVYRPIKPVQ